MTPHTAVAFKRKSSLSKGTKVKRIVKVNRTIQKSGKPHTWSLPLCGAFRLSAHKSSMKHKQLKAS